MITLFMIGRIVLGAYFVMAGLNHFMKSDMMAGYAASRGMKGAKSLVVISGIVMLLGGLGILLGVFVPIAIIVLVLFLLAASFGIHHFWTDTDPQQKMAEMQHFLKNLALAGAILMLLLIELPWPLSVL